MRTWLAGLAKLEAPTEVEWREDRECGIRAYPWEVWASTKKPKVQGRDQSGGVKYDDEGRVYEDPNNIIGDKKNTKEAKVSKQKKDAEGRKRDKADTESVMDKVSKKSSKSRTHSRSKRDMD